MTLLATPRMQLRPVQASDEGLYVRLYTDAETLKRVAAPMSPGAASAAFHAALGRDARRWPLWVMWRLEDGAAIGVIGLDTDAHGHAEIGAIVPPEIQGLGYAREAAVAVIDHAFSALGVARVETRHVADHPLVEAVMRGLGFHRAPEAPPPHPHRWHLTPEQWRARQGDSATGLG